MIVLLISTINLNQYLWRLTQKLLIVNFDEIYRVPNTSQILSISYYEAILNQLQHIKKDIVLGTDQNFDYLIKYKNQVHSSELMDLFLNADLQLQSQPE